MSKYNCSRGRIVFGIFTILSSMISPVEISETSYFLGIGAFGAGHNDARGRLQPRAHRKKEPARMKESKSENRKPKPMARAIFTGVLAGILAGLVAYALGTGTLGFVVGFVVGVVAGSRTVLLMDRAREQQQ